MLTFYTESENAIKAPLSTTKSASARLLKINAIDKNSKARVATQAFIQQGFSDVYGATISVTTPYLLSLERGTLKSALGVRSAKEILFIEQYLNCSIEKELALLGITITRNKIAEIAHLYSNAKVFTLPLLLVTALALHFKGFDTMVFTGTEHVIKLIGKTGISVHKIIEADPKKLTNTKAAKGSNSNDQWGSYYNSRPHVAFIRLNDVVKMIESSPKFANMFDDLTPQVANTVSQLVNL